MNKKEFKRVLKYLLSLNYDSQNDTLLNTKSYSAIDGISPDEFIRQLLDIQSEGYISVQFLGVPSPEYACYVRIKPRAKSYFQDDLWSKAKSLLGFLKPFI